MHLGPTDRPTDKVKEPFKLPPPPPPPWEYLDVCGKSFEEREEGGRAADFYRPRTSGQEREYHSAACFHRRGGERKRFSSPPLSSLDRTTDFEAKDVGQAEILLLVRLISRVAAFRSRLSERVPMQMTPPIDLGLHHHQLSVVSESCLSLSLSLSLPLPSTIFLPRVHRK